MEINLTDIPPQVQQAKQRLGIVGNAPSLTAAIQRAIQVAPIDLSVLVTGESGSGKEFFPQIIHQYSARKHSRYIAVNCGAIPEGTIDSELFGHEKGAFTGAVSSRKGYFEEADGGTIFLDEVAELPLTTQARLLRVLESGEFMKVGSSVVQRTNIRIVAATNVDMVKAVEQGRFREDLYYRLSTVQIAIPPLRERGNDIVLLARKFAADFAERYRMPSISMDDSARRLLTTYRWPGNVRQLKNVVEQLALFEAGNEVTSHTIEGYIPAGATVMSPALASTARPSAHSYDAEREALFNMIFRLQREIDELRSRLDESRHSGYTTAAEIDDPATTVQSLVKYTPTLSQVFNRSSDQDKSATSPRSGAATTVAAACHAGNRGGESEPPSLEETERETIRRSLERNMGRRKLTARELQISERTLYRKIKEYGLE
ncbi:MAG: sigma-54 dependent transcriptional regulator [Bacteroidales bacterium]|nr:sigma-54 dependent transcriptional regulator [Bacteroidales bacterium]